MSRLNHVTIYTDGAYIGNPGLGGYDVLSPLQVPHALTYLLHNPFVS